MIAKLLAKNDAKCAVEKSCKLPGSMKQKTEAKNHVTVANQIAQLSKMELTGNFNPRLHADEIHILLTKSDEGLPG